jgi:hypothetical protein
MYPPKYQFCIVTSLKVSLKKRDGDFLHSETYIVISQKERSVIDRASTDPNSMADFNINIVENVKPVSESTCHLPRNKI